MTKIAPWVGLFWSSSFFQNTNLFICYYYVTIVCYIYRYYSFWGGLSACEIWAQSELSFGICEAKYKWSILGWFEPWNKAALVAYMNYISKQFFSPLHISICRIEICTSFSHHPICLQLLGATCRWPPQSTI